MEVNIPLFEYDIDRQAILQPQDMNSNVISLKKRCVLCFFQDILEKWLQEKKIKTIFSLTSTLGKHPIYQVTDTKEEIYLFNPGLGGPMAAGFLEELIAMGCEYFIACGGAGVLHKEISMGEILLPIAAIRDEGLSYHYLPAKREITVNLYLLEAIKEILDKRHIPYREGKTWTTDAIYRETKNKVEKRKNEGCICVEMELASMLAVAQFRKVELAGLLYSGDNLDGDKWEYRDWTKQESLQEKLLYLCMEIVSEMDVKP